MSSLDPTSCSSVFLHVNASCLLWVFMAWRRAFLSCGQHLEVMFSSCGCELFAFYIHDWVFQTHVDHSCRHCGFNKVLSGVQFQQCCAACLRLLVLRSRCSVPPPIADSACRSQVRSAMGSSTPTTTNGSCCRGRAAMAVRACARSLAAIAASCQQQCHD